MRSLNSRISKIKNRVKKSKIDNPEMLKTQIDKQKR